MGPRGAREQDRDERGDVRERDDGLGEHARRDDEAVREAGRGGARPPAVGTVAGDEQSRARDDGDDRVGGQHPDATEEPAAERELGHRPRRLDVDACDDLRPATPANAEALAVQEPVRQHRTVLTERVLVADDGRHA